MPGKSFPSPEGGSGASVMPFSTAYFPDHAHKPRSTGASAIPLAPVLRGLCAWSGKYAVEKGITLAPLPPSGDGKDLPGTAESFPEA